MERGLKTTSRFGVRRLLRAFEGRRRDDDAGGLSVGAVRYRFVRRGPFVSLEVRERSRGASERRAA